MYQTNVTHHILTRHLSFECIESFDYMRNRFAVPLGSRQWHYSTSDIQKGLNEI